VSWFQSRNVPETAIFEKSRDAGVRTTFSFISIDQNSQPLWDPIPKLVAAHRLGGVGVHCVEDVDVAFTRRGAGVEENSLELARECVYRDGQSDWGAALFYTEFLGRNPLDIRCIEPIVGMKLSALARVLGTDVDGLYARWAVSDNWQLVGSSYVGNKRVHRVLGDIKVDEAMPFIRLLWLKARQDMDHAFPDRDAQARLDDWFREELHCLECWNRELIGKSLAELYRRWMTRNLPSSISVDLTSSIFSLDHAPTPGHRLLLRFVTDYDRLSALYNAAVDEAPVGVARLNTKRGELPFFLVWRRQGHWVRTEVLLDDGRLDAGFEVWDATGPVQDLVRRMKEAGVVAMAGKALLLVLQVRLGPDAPSLLLPENGSLYMPAAFCLEAKLRAAGVVPPGLPPVRRVCLGFLDHLRESRVRIALPSYLSVVLGERQMTAADLGTALPDAMEQAERTLASLHTIPGRETLLDRLCPDLRHGVEAMESRRRELARDPARRGEAADLWDRIRTQRRQVLEQFVEFTIAQLHVRAVGNWNSRGALLPWSIALGGRRFYDRLIANAKIVEEGGVRLTRGHCPARIQEGLRMRIGRHIRPCSATPEPEYRLQPPPAGRFWSRRSPRRRPRLPRFRFQAAVLKRRPRRLRDG